MRNDIKKLNKEHWSRNVPGLGRARELVAEINKDFFDEVDAYRIRNEPYVVSLIEEFSRENGRILEVGCGLGADSGIFPEEECA